MTDKRFKFTSDEEVLLYPAFLEIDGSQGPGTKVSEQVLKRARAGTPSAKEATFC